MTTQGEKKYAIIVAGGSGSRMKTTLPKQFLQLGELPILAHTILAFHSFDSTINIIVVLPEDQINYWRSLCVDTKFEIPHEVVVGGESRFQSVKNGIKSITNQQGLVAIHDGVRPFITKEIIESSFDSARHYGSGVACTPLKDTIRKKTKHGSSRTERSDYVAVQTPQTFQLEILKSAFCQAETPIFTDDANVVECQGHEVHLIHGSYENIKITSPEDMILAEKILSLRQDNSSTYKA